MNEDFNKYLESINTVHMDDIGDPESTSLFIKENNYIILTLRFLKFEKGSLENEAKSFLLIKEEGADVEFSTNEKYITLEVKNNKNFEPLNGGLFSIYKKVASKVAYTNSLVEKYADEVEVLEDKIFDQAKLRFFLADWFNLKKGLLKFNRNIERLIIVLNDFLKKETNLIKKHKAEFYDLIEDLEYIKRLVITQLEKLDNIYNYYTSIKNDHLNRNIYILSVLSGIFLPLNLLVGFFGMNTTGMYFADHPAGTKVVFYSIIIIFVFLMLGFPILNILNKWVISKLFGRYQFYNKMSAKLEKLSEDFNILDNKL